ncbi:hypothetical protein [Gilvimarinus polysaccharolyticus]|uniref:hypothetical protein n=1 Tax=Gilvimarinus polysaccharolyticus TaxID=863921 RepID=UPI000673AFE7|nr:hypothetical protein [Gilvimarinus polysaccharolyticus]
MSNKEWVEGQRVSPKRMFFGAAFFVFGVCPFAYLACTGSGAEQWFGLIGAIVLFVLVLFFVLYRTRLFVDPEEKLLYVEKSLGVTWVKEFSYGGCCLDTEAVRMMRGSPGGEYGSHAACSILLVDKVADKKILLFSSDDRVDTSRVFAYLKKYVEKC